MDEFKPEDELKPDTSDRRPVRSRRASSAPKVAISRQHMMMGIGILVLLLLVLGIGSALKSPGGDQKSTAQTPSPAANSSNSEKSIDLSGSSSMSGQSGSGSAPGAPQELNAPQIASSPTEARPLTTPEGQQRVELPGDLNNALSNQQGQVDTALQGNQSESSLPMAPATVVPGAGGDSGRHAVSKPQAPSRQAPVAHNNKPVVSAPKPVVRESRPVAAPAASAPAATASRGATPGGNYTLQLSSASRSDTLNAWARKQNLNGYHVYQTTRNGQPWFVLVSGSYATSAEAKRAVATLPAEVRAQNPWVKPVSQVKKEAGK